MCENYSKFNELFVKKYSKHCILDPNEFEVMDAVLGLTYLSNTDSLRFTLDSFYTEKTHFHQTFQSLLNKNIFVFEGKKIKLSEIGNQLLCEFNHCMIDVIEYFSRMSNLTLAKKTEICLKEICRVINEKKENKISMIEIDLHTKQILGNQFKALKVRGYLVLKNGIEGIYSLTTKGIRFGKQKEFLSNDNRLEINPEKEEVKLEEIKPEKEEVKLEEIKPEKEEVKLEEIKERFKKLDQLMYHSKKILDNIKEIDRHLNRNNGRKDKETVITVVSDGLNFKITMFSDSLDIALEESKRTYLKYLDSELKEF